MSSMSNSSPDIRSYVIRAARMSKAQKMAYLRGSADWLVPYSPSSMEWDALFPGASRRIVEVGFGMGDATRRMAGHHPDWGILGIEVHPPGIGKLLWWIDTLGLKNLKIVEHNAVEVFDTMIPNGSVDGVHIWFPDPWPKKRHHKRRLIQIGFVEMVIQTMKRGGYFHIATDWEPYAKDIMDVLESVKGLVNPYGGWAPKPDYRPQTKFENRGIAAERPIRDIIFVKELP